jgi:hypothetical protein
MKSSKFKNMALSLVVIGSMTVATETRADTTTALAVAGAGLAGFFGYEYGKSDTPAMTTTQVGTTTVASSPNIQVVAPTVVTPGTVATSYTMSSIPVVRETVVVEKPVVVEKYIPVYIQQRQSPTVIFY